MRYLGNVVLAVIVAVTMASVANVAAAETYDWVPATSNNALTWSTTANWTVGGSPAGSGWPAIAGDTINMVVDLAGPQTVVIDGSNTLGPITVSNWTMNDTASTYYGWTVTTTNTARIVFDNTAAGTSAMLAGGGGSHTIASLITLNSTLSVTNSSISTLTLSGTIAGAGGIYKDGAGLLQIRNVTNSFEGGLTIVAGTVTVFTTTNTTVKPFGTGAITLAGGTLQVRNNGASGATINIGNDVTVTGTSTIYVARDAGSNNDNHFNFGALTVGTYALVANPQNDYDVVFTGTVTLAASNTYISSANSANSNANQLQFNNVVSDGGLGYGFTKIGAGPLVLKGTGAFTGTAVISDGTLILSHSNAVSSAARVYVANSASLTVSSGQVGMSLSNVYFSNTAWLRQNNNNLGAGAVAPIVIANLDMGDIGDGSITVNPGWASWNFLPGVVWNVRTFNNTAVFDKAMTLTTAASTNTTLSFLTSDDGWLRGGYNITGTISEGDNAGLGIDNTLSVIVGSNAWYAITNTGNTYSGDTYNRGGMLIVGGSGSLGSNPLVISDTSWSVVAFRTNFFPTIASTSKGVVAISGSSSYTDSEISALLTAMPAGMYFGGIDGISSVNVTIPATTGQFLLGGGYGSGTSTPRGVILTAANALTGANQLVVGATGYRNGYLRLAAANDYSAGTLIGPGAILELGVTNAAGSGDIGTVHTAELRFGTPGIYTGKTVTATGDVTISATGAGNYTVDWSLIQGTRTMTVYARGTNAILELTGTLGLTGGGMNIRTDNNSLVILSGSNPNNGGRSISIGSDGNYNGNLVVQNVDRLGNGNLNIADARLIFDGVTWEQFTGNRTAGYGSGTNQWQFSTSYGGFAARGTTLVIVANTNVFDRNAGLGSTLKINGTWYANAPVVIASDIMLSDVRQLAVAQQGPGVFGQPGSGIVYTISGNIGGTGTIRLDWPLNYMVAWNQMAELVLAGTNNTWTGGRNGSGRGGMAFDNAEVFVRFAGNASLPKGAGSSTAYLMATRNNNANTEAFGYLLTTSTSGERYTLPGNYRFFIGAQGNASDPRYGVFGASSGDGVAGSAEFTKSTIIAAGLTSTNASQGSLALMVRDGLLTLGSTGVLATDGAVNFVPGAMILSGSLTAPANPVTHSVTTFTLKKSGEGTLVLGNVNYTDVTSSTNTASQFKWQIGGAGGGTNFQGAVRETGSDQWNSTAAFPLSIQNGVLELGAGDFTRPLGTSAGQVVLNSGGFAAFGGVRTVNIGGASGTLSWNVNFLSSAGALIFGSLTADNRIDFQNPINLNGGTRTIQTIHGSEAGAVVDLQGEITNGALTFGNALTPWSTALTAGKAIMSGSMSYTGTTMVNAGSVIFNGQGVASDSPIVVAAGLTVGGSAMLNRPMILGTGATLTPGNSIGTLGVTDLSLDNAILNWDLAIGSVGDTVLASSNLTAAGVSTFNFSGSFGAGLYNLIDYGTFSGTITNFAMNGSAPGGLNWLLRDNTESGAIQLLIYASANEWASTTGGDWSTGTNWTGGVPNAIGADANFGSNLASADTVNLDIAPTVGAIKFDNANKYTIGGTYTLTLATSSGNASIQVDTGSHEIAAPVTLGSDLAANIAGDLLTISGPMDGPYGVTKTGAGKLEINGTATYTGTTHVVNGELALGAAQTLGAVVIDSSALVTLVDGATQISSLEIAGGSSAPEAKLDIMSSALIIDYSGSESPLAEIEALIIKGYNGGDWAGNGITSSVLFDITAEAIGVIDNTTFLGGGLGEFAGRSIGMETVLVRKVIAGDIDMSGEVNAADYFYIDFNLDTAGGGWGAGDLDYSGETNSADYFYIDFNLGMSEGASMGTSIPEPATLVLLTLGGLAVIRRKRK